MHELPPIDAAIASLVPEACVEDPEMTEILRSFAERHEQFLREQESEPALPAVQPVTRR